MGVSWSRIIPSRHPHHPTGGEHGSEERALTNDEHAFPYIVAHVSMLYEVYSDYISLYEEKYIRCGVECRGTQRDTMAI